MWLHFTSAQAVHNSCRMTHDPLEPVPDEQLRDIAGGDTASWFNLFSAMSSFGGRIADLSRGRRGWYDRKGTEIGDSAGGVFSALGNMDWGDRRPMPSRWGRYAPRYAPRYWQQDDRDMDVG